MDYLRNLGSAAVSSLVQKTGLTLPFALGAKISTQSTIWNLYDGTRREDSTHVSIFEFDLNDPVTKKWIPLAKNTLRKLRTTRHPDVLKFLDAVETDATIYIMTERVRPLASALQRYVCKGSKEREDWLVWGLHRISVALAFLNEECGSAHGNICPSSIFISPSGEWKLGGFDVLSNPKEEDAVLYTMGGLLPDASLWASPEVKKSGWSVLKEHSPTMGDAYALGLLLHAVFNPNLPPPPTALPPHPPPQPSTRGAIPTAIFPIFKRLLNPSPKSRLSVKAFLDIGMGSATGGMTATAFFANNHLVKICMGLDNFNLSSEGEKSSLLRTLKESASSFPPEFSSFKVLPSIVHALEFGGAPASNIVPLVLQLGKNTSPEEYSTAVLAPLIKLFASADRSTRMALLEQLPEYADKLDKKAVVEKIWPHLQTGFSDTVGVIRECTIKSIILLSPNLNDRILNNDLLRHLAKMQSDPEASIRTNTCILLGRLAPSLGYNTKRKVLVPAFARALKDPFLHTRVAGLMAFMAAIDCFEIEELATKVIPNVSPLMVDVEKSVRDQAFKAVEIFVKRLGAHASKMPETAATDRDSSLPGAPAIPGQVTLVNTAAGAAGALAGWAMSSLSKTLSPEMQTMMSAAGIVRPLSAPTLNGPDNEAPLYTGDNSSPPTLSQLIKPTTTTKTLSGKALQLGAYKTSTSAALAAQIVDEMAAEQSEGNPWGNDDLMDVNADQDDWSAFESAPPATEIEPEPTTSAGLGFTNIPKQHGMASLRQGESLWDTLATASHRDNKSKSIVQPASTPPSQRLSPGKAKETLSFVSPTPSQIGSPSPVPTTQEAAPGTASMSKEEKAAEMARRKEERKQRIAQLKEQKKAAALTSSKT